MKKSIMIIGGGLLQIPVIQTVQEMGYLAVVTDYNSQAVGMHYADIPIVMSTRDVEGSVRVAKEQNEMTPICAVLTAGTDASMTVAAVANALNLPGIKFEDAEAATNKIKMRNRFQEHHVPSPKFKGVWTLTEAKNACDELGLPLVIKPADNMGARGVKKITKKSELAEAFNLAKNASPSGDLIIEEYMAGPELSIDAVAYHGEITITGVADRIIEREPYFIETGHTMPSQLDPKIVAEACSVMKEGMKALGITNGCGKGDIKVTKTGVKIGELAARLSGGFMSAYTYPLSSGVDLLKAAIEVALGQEPVCLEAHQNLVAIERAIITEPGIVKSITGLEEALQIEGIEEIFLNVKPGDEVVVPHNNVEKAGHIIAVAKNLTEAEKIVAKCRQILKIEVDEDALLTMEQIRSAAKAKMKKVCYVCPTCDGKNCLSSVPGMGGIGTGAAFRRNIEALKEYKIVPSLINEVKNVDLTVKNSSFELSLPVLAAPITGCTTNLGSAIEEDAYNQAIVQGCINAGSLAFVGDGASPEKYKIGLQAIKEADGQGMAIFKPRLNNKDILKRIEAAEKNGAKAVGIDIDAAVFNTMALKNQAVSTKSFKELKSLIEATNLPVYLKGILNLKDAEQAVKAGAAGIIISNHGGRVLEQAPGGIDVLPQIAKELKGETTIMVDGGFRTGEDVFKGLALGADLVLIGRPLALAAVGMGQRGVSFYLKKISAELEKTMLLTGCSSLKEINKDFLLRIK